MQIFVKIFVYLLYLRGHRRDYESRHLEETFAKLREYQIFCRKNSNKLDFFVKIFVYLIFLLYLCRKFWENG